jgi:hypothetical protein
MLSVIESSCIADTYLVKTPESGERGLSQADPAVIGWDPVIDPNFQRCGLGGLLKVVEQQFVLKDTTGKNGGL